MYIDLLSPGGRRPLHPTLGVAGSGAARYQHHPQQRVQEGESLCTVIPFEILWRSLFAVEIMNINDGGLFFRSGMLFV